MRREIWDLRELLDLNCFPQSWQLNDVPARWLFIWYSMISLARFPRAVFPQTLQTTVPSVRISAFSDIFCFISSSPLVGAVEKEAGSVFSFLVVAPSSWISPSSSSSPVMLARPSSWNLWAILRNCSSCSWDSQSRTAPRSNQRFANCKDF